MQQRTMQRAISITAAALFAFGGIYTGILHDWTVALLDGFCASVCLFGYRGGLER